MNEQLDINKVEIAKKIILLQMEKNVINLNQSDSHFIDSIGVSDIEKNTQRILDSYTNLYNKGNFDKLNRACYRFLKRLKGVNEYDMNDTVIRYVVSTVCLRDFSQCYNIIESLAQDYELFDFNIYLFFLYLCEGRLQSLTHTGHSPADSTPHAYTPPPQSSRACFGQCRSWRASGMAAQIS